MPVVNLNNASPPSLGIVSSGDRPQCPVWHLMVIVVLIVTAGCASNTSTVENGKAAAAAHSAPFDRAPISHAMPDSSDNEQITPDPLSSTDRQKDEPALLGERLGRLDALIRTAPPDSARKLREEYQRLLSQFTGEEQQVQTGNSSGDIFNPARPNASSAAAPPVAPIDSFLSRREGGSSIRRRDISPEEIDRRLNSDESHTSFFPSVAATAAEPTTTFSEIDRRRASAPNVKSSQKVKSSRRGVQSNVATERRSSRRQRWEERNEPTQESHGSRASTSNGGQRQFIEGIASAQAGDNKAASEALARSLESRDLPGHNRPRAEYSYGTSLEGSGRAADAAVHYRKAAKSGQILNQKAYIAQCRALARSGKRNEARTMLVDFIRRNPKSPQVISARKMLQTL